MKLTEILTESKWDYPEHMKGKGPSPDYLRTDIKNKEARKAFRKAERAKAHKQLKSGKTEKSET